MKNVLILKKRDFFRWPFSSDIVQIQKKGYGLSVIINKKKYNLNGAATKGEPLENIWLDNPEIPGTKISISRVLKECREFFK